LWASKNAFSDVISDIRDAEPDAAQLPLEIQLEFRVAGDFETPGLLAS
jgi:hypothetical protein